MELNIISYTLLFFVMVMIFPSLIIAPWTVAFPPKPPEDDKARNCAQWIIYHGFTLDNYEINRASAIRRNVMKDQFASTWAAIYAFKIGGQQDIYKILPQDFCKSFGSENFVLKYFKALKDEYKNCENWIMLYGFSETDLTYNFTHAMNHDPLKMKYISIWAYIYWILLWYFDGKYRLTPMELCSKMGKQVGEISINMPFMCEHRTKLSCKANTLYNLSKAIAVDSELMHYPILIQYFPNNYAVQLVNLWKSEKPVDHLTPMEFCKKYDGESNEPIYGFDYRDEE